MFISSIAQINQRSEKWDLRHKFGFTDNFYWTVHSFLLLAAWCVEAEVNVKNEIMI